MSLPQIAPNVTRIGWIGTGVMGASMCGHLIAAGYSATVYSRTKDKAAPLLDRGAQWADSPAAVAAASDVVFSIVGYPADVREVLLGKSGALSAAKPGTVLVDMTTSQPSLAVEIFEAAGVRQVHSIDAPVSGGDIGARNATLSIMIGGDRQVVDALQPLWQTIGKTIVYQGPAGSGQHTKMVNQTLIAAGMVGVCEALLYGYKAGLDLTTVLQSVASGAAGSWSLSNLGPRIIANNFDPGFYVEHIIKDLGLVLEESRRMGLFMPGLALAEQLYQAVRAQGYGRCGTQSLILALAAIAGVDWRSRSSGN
ncbi:MAG: 2-hydroxy-3-oxopropionate reductase [Planctomycetota bacterium]|jgi:3-hydroxyisobutyrate dehydrogenase